MNQGHFLFLLPPNPFAVTSLMALSRLDDEFPPSIALKSRPTLDTFVISSSSHGNGSDSASSHQQSSIGLTNSSTGEDTEWSLSPSKHHNNTPLNRRTTKDLIALYERNDSNFIIRKETNNTLSLNMPLPELPKVSPLRESFRNLLTALGSKKFLSKNECDAPLPFKRDTNSQSDSRRTARARPLSMEKNVSQVSLPPVSRSKIQS